MRVLSNQKYTIAEAYPTLLQAVRMRSNNDDNDYDDDDDDQRSQPPIFYRTQVSLGSDLWVLIVTPTWFADLTDVTLADEDINSTPVDDVNRAILGNVAMQVTPPGGQNWN